MHSWIKKFLCDHVLGEFTLYGVITKHSFLICPKFEGKVVSQSWKHCTNNFNFRAFSLKKIWITKNYQQYVK